MAAAETTPIELVPLGVSDRVASRQADTRDVLDDASDVNRQALPSPSAGTGVLPAAVTTTPWTWGRIKDVAWAVLGIAGILYVAGWLLQLVTSIVLLFVVSALLAYIVSPLVEFLEERTGWSRTGAALAAYGLVVAVLSAAGAWGVSQLASQVSAAVTSVPLALQSLRDRIPDFEERARAFGLTVDIRAIQDSVVAQLQGAGVASQGVAWAAAAGDAAMNAFLVLFLSFYLVVDGERLSNGILEATPDRWKPYTLFTQKTLFRVVGGYLRGQLLMGAIIGIAVFLGCLLLGVKYSLLLGILGFFFEMIPMVGPVLIGVAMTGVALFTSLKLAAIVLAFYLVLQLVESNVLGPKITGNAVGLHPIASMLGLLAGAKLFGLWGALFAVPVLGFAFVVIAAVYRQVRGLDPASAVARRQPHRPWPARLVRRPGSTGTTAAA